MQNTEVNQGWQKWIYLWARDCPTVDAMDDAKVDSRTAVDVMQWLREACSTKLQRPIILGGPGVIVQIVSLR